MTSDNLPKLVQFRPGPFLARELAVRATRGRSVGDVGRRLLEQHLRLLSHELRRLRLSPGEAALVCDALNGTMLDDELTVLNLWIDVEEAIGHDNLHVKWSVDEREFVPRIRALTPAQCYALADAVQRFGQEPVVGDLDARLRAVGLTA